jgi:UDP-N-acetyl-D-glucosamine dehydrogenase
MGPVRVTEGLADRLRAAIEGKTARVAVIGQGYVGLPLAVEFARAGFRVAGVETDPARVAALSRGESYIPDVPAGQLQDALQNGRFRPTAELEALAEQDAIVVCVPTPLRKSRDPDISYVLAAAEAIARHLRPGQLIVLESTTYPGTTEEVLLPSCKVAGSAPGRTSTSPSRRSGSTPGTPSTP